MARPTDDYSKFSVEQTLRELGSNAEKGLTDKEAKSRLARHGFNEVPEKEVSLLRRILERFWAPIPWMIEAAALLSAAGGEMGRFHHHHGAAVHQRLYRFLAGIQGDERPEGP